MRTCGLKRIATLPANLLVIPLAMLSLILLQGCNVDTPADVQRALQQATKPDASEPADGDAAHSSDGSTSPSSSHTTWDAIYLKGSKVGYSRTTTTDWIDPANSHRGVRQEADWVM